MAIAESGPSAAVAKNFSNLADSMPRPIAPMNSPFAPVTLRAITVVQTPVMRLYTGSISMDDACGSDLKLLKYGRSATLTGGVGHAADELISLPSLSNRLTPPT